MDLRSRLLMMGAAGAGGDPNFFLTVESTGNTLQARDIDIDANNNIFMCGNSGSYGLLLNINKSGSITWQKENQNSTFSSRNNAVAITSGGDIYTSGIEYNNTGGNSDCGVRKYDSTGAITWARGIGTGDNDNGFDDIKIDSSGNVYAIGSYVYNSNTAYAACLLVKYDSSGTLQWQRSLNNGNQYVSGTGIHIDGSDNIFITASVPLGGGNNALLLAKYNTSGTIQWQRYVSNTSSGDYSNKVATDSSGNIYCAGQIRNNSENKCGIAKFDSTGTLSWVVTIDGEAGSTGTFRDIVIDTDNSIYVVGVAATSATLVAKYNTSGTVQWQRKLTTSSSTFGPTYYGIKVKGDNIIIAGTMRNANGRDCISIAKLPKDGSKTGTYGVYSYQSTSYTERTRAGSSSTGGTTDTNPSLTTTSPTRSTINFSSTSTVLDPV